ncbi:MAG: HEAT repeat domain-containing protein [Gomphosphaeria aponina SAG 52.96 = DSM 107014]|uniref:HEAT repeat domain-containing protein n=1 Tax=Gomphosphaeria aponina SAG 52.96 = DSM 107014 TaxID=1521640 RepID=A0A941GSB7_9CHRO|nr:HEAT repeat domain-containing protein [Gomphosphaeria aponina SAG 52.96 = DSM 107014]
MNQPSEQSNGDFQEVHAAGNNNKQIFTQSGLINIYENNSEAEIQLTGIELKNAVYEFLSDIEGKFQDIKLFHAPKEKVALIDQYIPIQVTLERIYQEKLNESLRSYGESEEEIKRIYAAKGEKYERKQEDWQKEKGNHQRIMILADPGMGKSTLLRMEALTIAREEKEKLSDANVENLGEEDIAKTISSIQFPLYLRLSDLAEVSENIEKTIINLVKRDYPKTGQKIAFLVRKKLKDGKCLLLLDALDEVAREKRLQLQPYLNPFIKSFDHKTICTSRIVGYSSFLEDAKEMEIVPFTEKQIEEYIKFWFENAQKAKLLEDESVSAVGLINEIKNKPQIQGLTQNPLLLSLVCSLYQTKGLELPARKTQVYKKAVEYMLSKWSADNQRLSSDEGWVESKKELLEFLAYQFSCKNTEVLSTKELKKQIDIFKNNTDSSDFEGKKASDLLKELSEQDGILQKLSEEATEYLFLHRTFQEYLTASYIYEKIKENQEEGIALVKEHLWHFDWHETISLVAGLMDNHPLPLLKAIMEEQDDIFNTLLLLTGLCISECPNLDHPLITEVVNKIVKFWRKYPTANFIQPILIALGKIGNEQAVSGLIQALKNSDADVNVRYNAAWALGKIGNEQAVSPLINALTQDPDTNVRSNAAKALGEIGNEQAVSGLIQALKDCKKDCNYFVIQNVISALEKIGCEPALFAIKQHLKYHVYPCDVLNITLPNICTIIQSGRKIENIIGDEQTILGRVGNKKKVSELIQALKDPNPDVRYKAAIALGERGDEQAVSPLIDALKDSDSHVRSNAADALEKINSVEIVIKLFEEDELDIYRSDIFLLARKLMVRHSQKLTHPLIKVSSEFKVQSFELK